MYETVAKHAESEGYLLIMNVVNPGRCCWEECRNAFQLCSQKTVFTRKKTSPATKRFPRVSAAFAIEKLIRAVSGLDSVPIRRLFYKLQCYIRIWLCRENNKQILFNAQIQTWKSVYLRSRMSQWDRNGVKTPLVMKLKNEGRDGWWQLKDTSVRL